MKVDGTAVPREHQLLSVNVVTAANRIASARLSDVSRYFRVCTSDECRYRLCGITVAPRMLTAM